MSPSAARRRGTLLVCAAIGLTLTQTACVHRIYSDVPPFEEAGGRGDPGLHEDAPLRAYLPDNHLVVFEPGWRLENDSVQGSGVRYDPVRQPVGPVQMLPLDSVVGFQGGPTYLAGRSLATSILSSMAAAAGAAILFTVLALSALGP